MTELEGDSTRAPSADRRALTVATLAIGLLVVATVAPVLVDARPAGVARKPGSKGFQKMASTNTRASVATLG
jgi:hypothetical protein